MVFDDSLIGQTVVLRSCGEYVGVVLRVSRSPARVVVRVTEVVQAASSDPDGRYFLRGHRPGEQLSVGFTSCRELAGEARGMTYLDALESRREEIRGRLAVPPQRSEDYARDVRMVARVDRQIAAEQTRLRALRLRGGATASAVT